jgi:RsiW-degrading membrane proteinase PrsW (M82 family)
VNASGVKLGVVLGMVTTIAAFFPILKLTMGHCFFEQGCGEHENLRLLGVLLASCLSGLVAAWIAAYLYTMVVSRGSRN